MSGLENTAGFTGKPCPPNFNIARYCLEKSAKSTPDKIALIVVDEHQAVSWRYGEIEQLVLRIAGGLSAYGFPPASRLLIRMGNSFDYALMFFAANAAGLVPIPASSMLTEREAGYIAQNAGISAIINDGELSLPPQLPDNCAIIGPKEIEVLKTAPLISYAATNKDDPAFLVFTSGTSGTPKGVLHGQRSVWGRRPMYHGWYGLNPDDRLLHSGAFNWTYTLGTGLFDPWANGATAIIYTGERRPTIWPAMVRRHKASIMAAVPGVYRQMLKYNRLTPESLKPLRHCLTAGEALPDQLAQNWHKTTGLQLYEALGMSEISTYVSTHPGQTRRAGSPGKPQQTRAVKLLALDGSATSVPVGETGLVAIHRSDPGLMLGYWRDDAATRAAFHNDWFITGDLGHFDDDGYFFYGGRNDAMMNTSGYRVSPQEVETLLNSHGLVAESLVREVAVREDLSIITGYIVAHNKQDFDPQIITDFMAQNLAAYKCPKQYILLDELPRTANGKIIRNFDPEELKPV